MSADKYPYIFSRQMATIVYICPNFQNYVSCGKDLKDNKYTSLHLGRKYARIFVLGHYLFLVAHSFPGDTPSENSSLLGTDHVRGQHTFLCQMEVIVCLCFFSSWAGEIQQILQSVWFLEKSVELIYFLERITGHCQSFAFLISLPQTINQPKFIIFSPSNGKESQRK